MANTQFFKELKTYFNEKDLYKIFNLDRKCSTTQIQKAYKKLSLLYHPDRNNEALKEESKIKFQLISKIHLILSDKDKRILYDQNGADSEFDNLNNDDDFQNWEVYWRSIYPKISLSDIQSFEAKYKNSDDEKNDLKGFYLKHKGDFNKIMEDLMFSDVSEETRYKDIINDLIQTKQVPSYAKFVNETKAQINKRKRKAEKENKEWEASNMNKGEDLEVAIKKSIQKRESEMNSFFNKLEAKYAKKPKSTKKQKK